IKYDLSGTELWSNNYNGTGNGEDRPYGIIVDNNKDIYITGSTLLTGSQVDFLTMKILETGSTSWTKTYNGNGNGEDKSYGIITDGINIYITGVSTGAGTGNDFVTMGYKPDGSYQFMPVSYNGTGNNDDIPYSIDYTTSNRVIVTGSTRTGSTSSSEDAVIISYRTDGSEDWLRTYNNPSGNNSDVPLKVVEPQNSSSFVSVAGYTIGRSGQKDIMVLSYTNSGNLRGASILNGPAGGDDIASTGASVANNLIYTGFITNNSQNTDIITGELIDALIIGIEKDPNLIPTSFKLYQNYPNPFNPVTKIKFDIPDPAKVNLIIYDQLGRRVETLVSDNLESGSYETTFDASPYASGVYFYTLTTDGFAQTNKLVI